MKTLARPSDVAEIARRLSSVRPGSVARWGRMSVHQMVCHLSDACRMALGETQVSHASGRLQRTIVKGIALHLPLPWPRGLGTRPELDSQASGTQPREFAADLDDLAALFERLTAGPPNAGWPLHPIFGPLTHAEWLRWGYLHMDHHLRQFGA